MLANMGSAIHLKVSIELRCTFHFLLKETYWPYQWHGWNWNNSLPMYCDSISPPPILTSTLYAHMTLNWFSVIVHACKLTHTTTYIKWQQHGTPSSYHIQCNTEKGPQHTILILRGGPTQLHGKNLWEKKRSGKINKVWKDHWSTAQQTTQSSTQLLQIMYVLEASFHDLLSGQGTHLLSFMWNIKHLRKCY